MSRSTTPSSRLRLLLLVAAFAGLGLYVWLAVQVYLSKKDPEHYSAGRFPYSWIIGPPAKELTRAARDRMKEALAVLDDRSRPADERLRLSREQLERAEALLLRSLRAQPAQARALAGLAAVRYELRPPLTAEANREMLELITLASSMAPTYPAIQRDLGELLLKMGRRQEAMRYLARSIELDPDSSRRVVGQLRDQLFGADEIRSGLPDVTQVLAELEGPYADEGRLADYLVVLDDAFAGKGLATAVLLRRYGNAGLRLGAPEALLRRMEALEPLPVEMDESSRLEQIARALTALGRHEEALVAARGARRVMADEAGRMEFEGDTARAGDDAEAALAAYRDALRAFARKKAAPAVRARIYRKIALVEEARGRPDTAYDAYRKALELNPADATSRARVKAMEGAAGFD